MSNIVEQSVRPDKKRVTYGIDITVGQFSFNEWGLHESVAKEVNELLTLNNNQPLVLEGVTFTRRKPSTLSAALAEAKAKLQPIDVKV
jgi:hypothetical protein